MKKILLTATVQSHIAQFHKPLINMLKKRGYLIHVAARDNLVEKNGLLLNEPDKIFNIPFDRSPISKNNIIAYKQLKKIINYNSYDIIHCNTPMGGIITRLAAKKERLKGTKVFYTVHGFHFYKGSPKKNWIIYYPIEKLFARYTDKLITITKEDYKLANNNFKTKIFHTHGVGVNSQEFKPYSKDKILKLKESLGYSQDDFILICVGELNKNKNQSIIIRAVAELVKEVPNIKLLLAGNGPMEDELKILSKQLYADKFINFIGYTNELSKYINISDIVISASYREGLPLNIMEGMLCEKPVIASNNRGHNELIQEGRNGFLFNPNDHKELKYHIINIFNNPKLYFKLGLNGSKDMNLYTDESVLEELTKVYE